MNQTERESLFREEEPILGETPRHARFFSPHGNHKRSLVGKRWYYLAESDLSYNLFYDEVVDETETSIWLRLWMDERELTENTIHISREQYDRTYPVQPLFPHPMEHKEALSTLREYFWQQNQTGTSNDHRNPRGVE